jgi:erythromycin esterase
MAGNFRRILDRELAGTKFVIWAHNGHIETGSENFPRMGYYLRQFYGDEYYALGFSFNQGSFQAWDQQLQQTGKFVIKSFTVNPAQEDSTEWYFSQTKIENFLLDFRTAAKNQISSEWLANPHPTRSIGAYFDNNSDRTSYYKGTPSQEFDGMVFINTTTRARPSQAMKEKYKE